MKGSSRMRRQRSGSRYEVPPLVAEISVADWEPPVWEISPSSREREHSSLPAPCFR